MRGSADVATVTTPPSALCRARPGIDFVAEFQGAFPGSSSLGEPEYGSSSGWGLGFQRVWAGLTALTRISSVVLGGRG